MSGRRQHDGVALRVDVHIGHTLRPGRDLLAESSFQMRPLGRKHPSSAFAGLGTAQAVRATGDPFAMLRLTSEKPHKRLII